MTPERIEEIYGRITEVDVILAPEPRERGPGYICSTIVEIQEKDNELTGILQEVTRQLNETQKQLRVRELETRVRTREKLLASVISELEGVSQVEKLARVSQYIEQDRLREAVASAPTGLTIPTSIPSLEQEICDLQNEEGSLKALKESVLERKKHLKSKDSAVRLQQAAMDTAARLFGRGNGMIPTENQTRDRERRRVTGNVQVDPSFEELSGSSMPPTPEANPRE